MSAVHQEDAHSGPIKNPRQLLTAVLYAFIVPVFGIIALVLYVSSGTKTAPGVSDPERAIALRIQKVGQVVIRDANRPLKTGEEVFNTQCAACHNTGAAGAPKAGDSTAWAPRIRTGFDALVQSALKGKNAMSAQGGGLFNDIEIARAVAYLSNTAGGKFTEPAPANAPAN
jgi:cytochrome c5